MVCGYDVLYLAPFMPMTFNDLGYWFNVILYTGTHGPMHQFSQSSQIKLQSQQSHSVQTHWPERVYQNKSCHGDCWGHMTSWVAKYQLKMWRSASKNPKTWVFIIDKNMMVLIVYSVYNCVNKELYLLTLFLPLIIDLFSCVFQQWIAYLFALL